MNTKKKVFVVDDESIIAGLIQDAVDTQADVSHIGSGRGCLDRLTKEKPDLLFVDMHIPEMGGLEMVSKMRKDPSLSKIPVVIMSSNHSEFEKNLVMNQGVHNYIPKPLKFQDISGIMKGIEKERYVPLPPM